METIEPLSTAENIQRRRRPGENKQDKCHTVCLGITRRGRAISRWVLVTYETALERFGFFLARKPFAVVLTTVILVIASCQGFINWHVEKPSENLFTAANSQSRQDMHHTAKFFPLLDTRKEELIILPQRNQNVLSKDCLNDAVLIHKVIVNISNYEELCAQGKPDSQQNERCVISSPLQMSGAQFENIENLSSILLSEWKAPSIILSTGKTFKSSVDTLLANFRSVNKRGQTTAWADALRIIYFVRRPTNENENEKVLRFEKSLEIAISSILQRLKCVSVSFKTGRTKSDALEDVLLPRLMPLCLSVLVIVAVLAFMLNDSTSCLSYLATALLIFVSILLPIICTAGVVSFVGMSLSPTAIFIPFLLLGKETSDLLIILREWKRQRNVPSLKHRVGNCVAKAGFLLTSSSLCCSLLLGNAIRSSFTVIANFFILALVACVTYTLVISILVVFQLSYQRQLKIAPDSGLQHCSCQSFFIILHNKIKQILKTLPLILTSLAGRIVSLFVLSVIIALCIISAVRPTERIADVESIYQQKNFRNFNEAREKFFSKRVDTSVTFFGKLNYSKESVQQEITSFCERLGNASYSQEESICWMSTFKRWARSENLSCLSSEFYNCLEKFLIHERNILFKQDIRFDATLRISASRIHLYMKKSNHFQEDKISLRSLRKDLKETSPLQAVPASDEFFRLDDLLLLEEDIIHVLIVASISVFTCSLITNASIIMSGYLTVTFILLILETALMMQAWEVKLNHLSFLTLFPGIVCSLTYSIQVSQTFVLAAKEKERVILINLLGYVAPSILWAVFISLVSSISLSFIFPSLRIIFLALIPLISLLGLLHALAFLPPILCLANESLAICDSLSETDIASSKADNSIELISLEDDVRKLQFKAERPGISIVGMSCQFPRAKGKDMFWELLVKGKCSIGKFPTNRSEQHKNFHELYHPKRFVSGRLCATDGSYLDEIQKFDNTFFGISNQEARSMDPQQRILLQVVYEAIEDAGIRLKDLQNCRTGVFVGVMNLEFGGLMTDSSNYKKIDQFSSTGLTASIIANRVSFCLNLTGPSVAVDTACSSSLTALKIACDNLHNGDCEVAIVCAPNIVLDHSMQIVTSMAGLLAPDGRCKSFDASGDGYGRGEGFAAVIIKLTAAALSDKDDMYCEIVACGMNNDGQSSVPITAPNAKIQAKLSKRVLEQSGMRPNDVDYFEAHGTGTAIGDVVEIDSIADVYTRETIRARKLRVGSVKSNLNHTESTSGLAGLIKVALMIKQQMFVPTVNVTKLNPKLKLDEKNMIIQQTCENWVTSDGKPRVGAVNSFGYGGSNVHAILREVKSSKPDIVRISSYRSNYVFTLSARSQSALKQMAKLLAHWLSDHVDDSDSRLTGDVCYSLNERRSQFLHRLAVPFRVSSDASRSLLDYANENIGWDKLVSYGESNSRDQKLVFMFGGQGAQWYGMGRQLIECEPVFKEAIWKVSNIITKLGETWSLVEELMASEEVSRISANWLAQPATFAVQYATAELLMSWGIYPSAVLGHSLGEFAAATTAGIITVKEAIQIVLTRSALQEKCPNNGGMAALGLSEKNAINLLRNLKLENTLEIAAVNDANSVTVSGDSESVQALGDHLKMNSSEVFWRVLETKRAFHSFHMESIQRPFHSRMKRISVKPQAAKVPFYSTVVGEVISGQELNPSYWWQNIRHHVQFFLATKHLLQDGYKQIVEISTQPILAHYVKQIGLQESLKEGESPVVLATLPRKRLPIKDHHKIFLQNTVCKLYSLGYLIDWSRVQGNSSAKFIRLPTYPWKENSFWYRERPPQEIIEALPIERSLVEKQSSTRSMNSPAKSLAERPHPFLKRVMMTKALSGLHCWETDIDLHRIPYLKDHALIRGGTVMPGASYLEMAFAMVKDIFVGTAGIELTDVRFSSLLTLPETQVRTLRLRLLMGDRVNEPHFQITNIQDEDSEIPLCNGSVIVDLLRRQSQPQGRASNLVSGAVDELITGMEKVSLEWFKEVTVSYGFNYGCNFSIIKQAWQHENKGVCLIDISHLEDILKETENYVIHPTILDACLQSCFVPLGASMTDGDNILPVGFRNVTLNDIPETSQLFCHVTAKLTEFGVFDVVLMSPAGNILLSMSEFRVSEMTSLPRQASFSEIAYEIQWKESHESLIEDARPDVTCIVLKDSSQVSEALVERLKVAKVRVIAVEPPSTGVCDNEAEKAITAAFSDAFLPNHPPNIRIINFWPAETSFLPNSFDAIEQAQSLAFKTSSFLMKLLIKKECKEPRLFLVTLRTQFLSKCNHLSDGISLPWGSTVWGLRRTANLEYLSLRVTTVDLSDNRELHDLALLAEEVLGDSIEDEVAFRDGKRFINRIVRLQMSKEQCPTSHLDKEKNGDSLCLATLPSSRQLCIRKQSVSAPSPSELKIKLLYSWTPSESVYDLSKPKGCVFVSGVVSEVPLEGIHGFSKGDVVCGIISSGRVGNCVNINVSHAFLKPSILTQEQAAYIPGCLAIAFHTLQRLTDSKESCQKVLIHEANQGPGPAIVLLATVLGHRAYCTITETCSATSKSALLEIGAEDVMYQKCPTLDGDAFDLFDSVLFFLQPSPNALQKSMRTLKKGGKLLILNPDFEGDLLFSANKYVKYEGEDIADVLLSPTVFQGLTFQSLELLDSKRVLWKLLELNMKSFDVLTTVKTVNASIGDSKQHACPKPANGVSFSVHSFATFGCDLKNIEVLPRGLDECGLKENRSYLVAGGMRGFGFEVARWMAENGAKTVGLLGRSKPSHSIREKVKEIEIKTGVKVYFFQVDISSQKQMNSFTKELMSLPNVAGIINTAMVLRDEYIKNLKFESFVEVMKPKITGSFLLHQISLNMDLDFFVMFSSMASIVGNMGQASYSAANAFQDSLAMYRRHVLGLPGLAINWGPIGGAGVMVREAGVAKLMAMAGLGFIDAKEGVQHMAKVLMENPGRCQISLFDADWPRFLKSNKNLNTTRLEDISTATKVPGSQISGSASLAQKIVLEKERNKRSQVVKEYVIATIKEWTGISSLSEVDLNKSLYSYGVDSTVALTLKMQLESSLQVSFEVFYFMQPDTTPLKLASDVATKLSGQHLLSELPNEESQFGDSPEIEGGQSEADPVRTNPATRWDSQVQVVPLYNPPNSAIKFFCVHPSHRYALSLVPISTGFQGQDLVSFYSLGFIDPTIVSEDWGGVRQLANHYVQLISKVQRHGPYFLGGYSYGGLLAYEMASILTEQNERVEFVAMIDTFPWTHSIRERKTSVAEDNILQQRNVELQFKNYLRKFALESLKMPADEYEALRGSRNEEGIIDELQQRSLEQNVSTYDLRALQESLMKDHVIASRTHRQWQPPEIFYSGHLTFLKCVNSTLSPRSHSVETTEEVWGGLVEGGTTVLVCPGDHYSTSELPHAHITGSILATALLFSYRILFPDFPRPPRTFSQRRAVEKYSSGVNVFLHSKTGIKRPHFGELILEETKLRLLLRSKNKKEKAKKLVDLKDLRMVQPGKFVFSSLKYSGRMRRIGAYQSGNLAQIAALVTSRRVYSFEFTDHCDLKAFYNMIEAIFSLTLTGV